MIHRISIILYRYKYRTEKTDRYPTLPLVTVCSLRAMCRLAHVTLKMLNLYIFIFLFCTGVMTGKNLVKILKAEGIPVYRQKAKQKKKVND